jgi:hypothetical protein
MSILGAFSWTMSHTSDIFLNWYISIKWHN